MNYSTNHIDVICRDLCAVLADLGGSVAWRTRLAATAVVLEQMTGIVPTVIPVKAAAYSRSAVFRLGGAMVPQHQGEVEQFREQVEPAMVLLGFDREAPHAVLSIAGMLVVEVAHGADWNDRGVLVRPFVHTTNPRGDTWIVDGLRYGVSIAYERANIAPGDIPAADSVIELAQQLHAAVDRIRHRASGE